MRNRIVLLYFPIRVSTYVNIFGEILLQIRKTVLKFNVIIFLLRLRRQRKNNMKRNMFDDMLIIFEFDGVEFDRISHKNNNSF